MGLSYKEDGVEEEGQEVEAPAQSHETACLGPHWRLMGAVTGPGPRPLSHGMMGPREILHHGAVYLTDRLNVSFPSASERSEDVLLQSDNNLT